MSRRTPRPGRYFKLGWIAAHEWNGEEDKTWRWVGLFALAYAAHALGIGISRVRRRPVLGGRRYDWWPVRCHECGLVMRTKDAYHGYQDDGMGDVEPVDECPRCGTEVG